MFIFFKELKEALKNLDEAKANKNWAMNEIKNVSIVNVWLKNRKKNILGKFIVLESGS